MIYLVNIVAVLVNSLEVSKFLHLYQCKDYSFLRYTQAMLKHNWFYLIICFVCLLIQICLSNLISRLVFGLLPIMLNPIFNLSLINSSKTPLKFTNKIKRLLVLSIIILIIPAFLPFGASLINLLACFVPTVANFVNIYDKLKNLHYIRLAQQKLSLSKAKVIAITGSNGKTSVKNILFEMLKERFSVLVTPKSYNTPLGISSFINQTNLQSCDYIILEYGARKRHQITKLCKTFGADYGIVTCVAQQHMATFKSMENVFKAKKELSDFLNYSTCVFNLDNIYTLRMFSEKAGAKLTASIYTKADVYATDIEIKNFKTTFTMHLDEDEFHLSTRLLGKHNITNITLAAALANKLGICPSEIIKAVENLNYVPHRLELIRGRVNVLDDSYNCSLVSASEAMWVLDKIKQDTNCNTIVVTPGIIEGGKFEEKINFKLGALCASADEVIIVGVHNKSAITRGLQSKSFARITYAPTLDDAKKEFAHLKVNDTLLLLNDLPDDYK